MNKCTYKPTASVEFNWNILLMISFWHNAYNEQEAAYFSGFIFCLLGMSLLIGVKKVCR